MEQVLPCILCCLQTTGGRSDSWYVPGTSITTLVPKCSIACPHRVIFRTTKHIWWNLLCSQKVVSDSLWPHGPQHARFPCSSLSPGLCSNSCPLSRWCYRTISSSVVPSSSCPQSFPASEPFPLSQLFTSGGWRIGASASASVLKNQLIKK